MEIAAQDKLLAARTNSQPIVAIAPEAWPIYRIYGLSMTSDFAFATPLIAGAGAPDLTFTCVSDLPARDELERTKPTFISPRRNKYGESVLQLYRHASCDMLRFTQIGDCYLWPDRIVCIPAADVYRYSLEVCLLGSALAIWLELRGVPVLHASAVAVDGGAVAFLSNNGGGKSGLAATFVQSGYPLLTDDILALRLCGRAVFAQPGYPQMRMWPDQAQHFLGNYDNLERVHPDHSKCRVPLASSGLGGFCASPQPVRCFYLPERRATADSNTTIEIVPATPQESLLSFVRYSFAARAMATIGVQPERLKLFAQMDQRVPIRRLVYPSGFEHLPAVRDAILADLDGIGMLA